MASFSRQILQQCIPYWYERLPFSQTVAVSTVGGSAPIIGQISGWNPSPSPSTLVTLEDVATVRDPNLQIQYQADGQTATLYTEHHRPDLEPIPVRAQAIQSLSLQALNTTSTLPQPSPVLYHVSVLQMPTVLKVLLGYGLTAAETAWAQSLGIDVSPVVQNGTLPIPIGTVVERTYLNRQVRSPTQWDGPAVTVQAGQAIIPTVQAAANELLVLTHVAADADEDYGPQLAVSRDNQDNHVVVDLSLADPDRGIDMFVPALDQLAFTVTTTATPPAPIPVRLTVLHLSLSNILRIRMGLLTEQELQQLFAQGGASPQQVAQATAAATRFYQKVLVGVY